MTRLAPLLLAALLACSPPPDPDPPRAYEDWSGDLLATDLVIDLATLQGTATIRLDTEGDAVSLEAGGLDVGSAQVGGVEVPFARIDDRLDIGLPEHDGAVEVTVAWSFAVADLFEGLMSGGMTLTWPYFCGNVFPCRSDPADGVRYRLELTGVPAGQTAIYAAASTSDAPAYQVAWAVGDYTRVELGTTAAGTDVVMWHLPDGEEAATTGTEHLVASFAWLEETLGPYPFGDEVGPVAVDWGMTVGGGIEHHPYWHVATVMMDDPVVQAHEAAHGWFGNGVRLACWEDIVLSEGLATYLAARALGAAAGAEAEEATWEGYSASLGQVFLFGDSVVLLDSCGEIDLIEDDFFLPAHYFKPAFMLRAIADEVGPELLDEVLGSFARAHVGQAARMQDLLDEIEAATGFDPTELADAWLRSTGDPRAR